MPNTEVRLTICAEVEALTEYTFQCPACHQQVTRHADRRAVGLLMSGRVPCYTLHVPREALEPHYGEPISGDDLIDLMVGLAGDPLKELMADG